MHCYLADFDDPYGGWVLLGGNLHYVCLGHTLDDYIDLLQLAANTEVACAFPAADPLGIPPPPPSGGEPWEDGVPSRDRRRAHTPPMAGNGIAGEVDRAVFEVDGNEALHKRGDLDEVAWPTLPQPQAASGAAAAIVRPEPPPPPQALGERRHRHRRHLRGGYDTWA